VCLRNVSNWLSAASCTKRSGSCTYLLCDGSMRYMFRLSLVIFRDSLLYKWILFWRKISTSVVLVSIWQLESGLTGMRFLFKFASCCTLCHYCCLNLHLAVHYVTTVVSFSLSQLTHLKTFLPVCDQQSLLLIDRDVTVVRCQCCS